MNNPRMKSLVSLFLGGCFACLGVTRAADEAKPKVASASAAEFFERRIRPILVENCQSCHGPTKQKSGLRLDSPQALRKGGDSGPVLKPGDPDQSLLIQAVRQTGELKMPPKKKLPPEALEALTTWVRDGAVWPAPTTVQKEKNDPAGERHWAFQPVADPALPSVKRTAWSQTPIDHFILARLEAKGLTPSPPADRRTLLRRVTFDLIGLPPTPQEIAAFEADASPDAFAKVVDRLLDSPHYGERWGRYWLDVARYADTKGYVFFQDPNYPWAWTYRDYVIEAFNRDLPYDQFILQQLAADRLDLGSDHRPLRALGFITAGGRFMNNTHDILDDRIDVVSRGLLGLTVTCARCHDHKFDPITMKDYYALYGVFNSSVVPTVLPLYEPPPPTEAYRKFEKELKDREQKLSEFLHKKHEELVASARSRVAEYLLAVHALRNKPSTGEFMLIADMGDLNPSMVVRWQAYLESTRKTHHPVFALWHRLCELPESSFATQAKDLIEKVARQSDPAQPMNPLVVRAFSEQPPKTLAEAAQRYAEVLGGAEKAWQEALHRAAGAKQSPPASLPDPAQEQLRLVFHGPGAPPNLPYGGFNDLELLPDRPSQEKLQAFRKEVEKWRASGPGAPPRAMVLEDAARQREARVFLRGNPNRPGQPAPRQVPAILTGSSPIPFAQGSGRLELARAIASRDNPLTARVFVNRVWLHHFGSGLVRTPSDFGLRSDPPTHPELLDYLARYFMDHGWSIKKLHRLIVLSAVYQQQSADNPAAAKADPENVLLWRMNRRRLDFEATRDALLAVSGQLKPNVGGPSVQNAFTPGATRRTLYAFLDRLNVPGIYRTFDFPSPDATNPQRDVTSVPQQALFLMNNPFTLDCARKLLARPEIATAKDASERVRLLYRLLYGRWPTLDEYSLAGKYLGDKPSPGDWEHYAHSLLLVNEFVFVD
jgi:mono/diheme cytochrome c family protein